MNAGDSIRSAREAKGWSQAQLANRVGISQPAIKKIEAGQTDHSKFLPKIAKLLDLDLADLDPSLKGGVEAEITEREVLADAQIMGPVDFPIHVSAEGGPGEVIVSTDPIDYMARPAPLIYVRKAYGVIVTGSSMEPEYRQGDIALVNPHTPYESDAVHIFYAKQAGTDRATIKHLRRATADQWLVTQWNPPAGMPHDFALSRDEWRLAHRVIGKYSKR